MNPNVLIPLVASVVYGVLLFVVVGHRFRNKVNRAFALYLLAMTIWSFGSFMLHANFVLTPLFWNKFMGVGTLAMPMAFLYFVQVFLSMRHRRRWLYLGLVSCLALQIANVVGYVIREAYTLDGVFHYEFGPAVPFVAVNWYFFVGLAIFNLIRRYRREKDEVYRNRIRYPLIGISLVVLGTFTNFTPLGKYPVDIAVNLINALLIAYAIVHHELLDISLVVRKGLTYAAMAAGIAATYLLTIFVFERLARTALGYGAYLMPILLAVVIAMVLRPLRGRVQAWIDRFFFRERYEAQQMLRRLSQTATTILDLNVLSGMLLEEVTTTMHIAGGCILLKEQGTGEFYIVAYRGLGEDVAGVRLRGDHPLLRWMAREGRVLTAHEIDMLPQFKALWGEEKEDLERLGAELFVPLLIKDDLVGLFAFGPRLSGEAYSQDEKITLTTLANQAAVAIEHAQLYQNERKRAAQLALVNQVAQRAASILDMDQLLQEVVTAIQQSFNYYHVGLFLLDEVAGEVKLEAIAGGFASVAPPDHRLALGKGMVGWTAKTGQSLLANDVSQEPHYVLGILKEALTQSELCVPLKLADKVMGVLDIQSTRLNAFDQTDLMAMETLADQIAMAIENARLFEAAQHELAERKRAEEALERRAAQLAVVNQVARQAASILDLDRLLQGVVTAIQQGFNYHNVILSMLDEGADALEVQAIAGGFEGLMLPKYRQAVGVGMIGWTAETGQSLLANDVSQEPRYISGFPKESLTKAELCVPLKLADKVLGVLDVQDTQLNVFDETDLLAMETLADQIAVAIENARLYQQTDEKLQTRVRELSALYAIAETMNHSFNLDAILQLALDSAIEMAGMESGGILLLDPSTNEFFLRAHRGVPPELIRAVSHTRADEGLMPRMLNSVLTTDNLSEVTKDRRVTIEDQGLQSLVNIPLKVKGSPLGVMVMASRSPRTFAPQELKLLAAIGNQVGVAVDRANLQAQELRAAILEERQNMARQMHDDCAQTLGYLGLQVDSVMDNLSLAQSVEVQAELEEVRKAIGDTYERVRSSITWLGEDIPGHFDLGAALLEIISEFEKQTGCKVESRVDRGLLSRLPPSVAFQVTHIIREALTNVRKHSGADSVHLTFQSLEDGMIEVTIEDNGRGFDLDSGQQSGWEGFGLRFMRERAERVGGSLRIESEPGQGTRVIVSLPSG